MSDIILVEPHLHTSEVSSCSDTPAAVIMECLHDVGYGGVVVTDHYYHHNGMWASRSDRERFLTGYYHARETGERLGMIVLPGLEFRALSGIEDYLVYGLTEEDILGLPDDLCEESLADACKVFHSLGGLVYQAHPFRETMKYQDYENVDGVEVLNTAVNHIHHANNEQALAFAREHDLLQIAGSDVHRPRGIIGAGLNVPRESMTPQGFVSFLRAHKEIREVSRAYIARP